MLFNSVDFAFFLPIVFLLYWFVFNKNLKTQNLFLVAASYLFYGWWDWRFLSLILFSTVVDYLVGQRIASTESPHKRRILLWISMLVNLGLLGFFKYYNFFLDNFVTAFTFFGQSMSADRLNIILPVGISFYTFQTMSYTIDVYRRKLEPTKSFIEFTAFVSFFPQLVAGPIERASNLLPQFQRKREFSYSNSVDGLRQMLWGFFKKMVIADNCARYVNIIFSGYEDYSGSTLVLGGILFAFQIYGDFSGYSDIAIGTARLMGFDLMRNFAYPYFSRDIAEFWRRWHISLSTWFRDYVYIPLGGSRGGTWMKVRNTFIIFIVSGFWHGANWTFIVWGALNAIYFLPLLLMNRNRANLDIIGSRGQFPSLREITGVLITFSLTVLAWIFFRAENITVAIDYIAGIFSPSLFTFPEVMPATLMLLLVFFNIIEWLGREDQYAIATFGLSWPKLVRYSFYYLLVIAIVTLTEAQETFIYFQF